MNQQFNPFVPSLNSKPPAVTAATILRLKARLQTQQALIRHLTTLANKTRIQLQRLIEQEPPNNEK